ncbi:hypothetical protein AOQ88_00490 [Candidatus Riesia sp. GBBU]|nr:hypothetical protein AOQ88_00490 [Candidatus Riesia sp. GBBU]
MNKIISLVIIFSIFFTSIFSYFINNTKDYIVLVNGEKITAEQFKNSLIKEKTIFQEKENENFEKFVSNKKDTDLYLNVLNKLIQEKLINQYMKKIKFYIKKEEIFHEIRKIPSFQENKKFSLRKYQKFLFVKRVHPDDLEKEISKALINRYINKIYFDSEFILPEEIKEFSDLFLQKRKVELFTLPFSYYRKSQKFTNKELTQYYENNKNKFFSDDKLKINYIKLNQLFFFKNIIVDKDEIKKFYNEKIDLFTTPEKIQYSMIQIRKKEEADKVLKMLSEGTDIKKIVERFTKEIPNINYEKLEWMKENEIPKKILSLGLKNKGQFSKIINLFSEYTIFILNDLKKKKITPIELVKKEIENIIRNEKARKEFSKFKNTIYTEMKNKIITISEIEKIVGKKFTKTEFFTRKNIPENIKNNKFSEILFKEKKSFVKKDGIKIKTFETDENDLFLFYIEEYKKGKIKSFHEVKNVIIEKLVEQKANQSIENDGNKLVHYLEEKKNPTFLKDNILYNSKIVFQRFEKNFDILLNEIFKIPVSSQNKLMFYTIRNEKKDFIIVKLINVFNSKPKMEEKNFFYYQYKIMFNNLNLESLILNLYKNSRLDFNPRIEL